MIARGNFQVIIPSQWCYNHTCVIITYNGVVNIAHEF